jgi:hypothetical protein
MKFLVDAQLPRRPVGSKPRDMTLSIREIYQTEIAL